MQFIQFGMLGALAALAIPIIIHLMFRQRARLVDLGTLQFLKVVLRDNARRRRLEALALAGAADGVPGPDRLPVRPAVHARDRAGRGRPTGRGAARPFGQHGTQGEHPADRSRAGRSAGDPGPSRPGNSTGSRARSTERSTPLRRRPTSARPRSSRRPAAPTTAPPWPGHATSSSARGKPSRNCTSSPIFSARGSIAVRP